jgi:hypothetical protein
MAGDWIKMRSALRRHPKVVRIASALQTDRLRVVGGLHAVWCLFDELSEDGRLYGYTPSALDSEIGFPGFSELLVAVEWLNWDGNDGLSLPEFDKHNGASAKRRAQEADRKRAERASSANGPQDVRDPSADDADKKRTREEKRREEKKNPPKPPAGAFEVPAWMPEKPWADFVAMRRAKGSKVPFTVAAAKGIVSKLEGFRAAGHDIGAILSESVINGWSGVFEPKQKPNGASGDWTGNAT